jgi:methionyl-tRNA formyltransferase
MKNGILLNKYSPISKFLSKNLEVDMKNFVLFYDNKVFSRKDKKIFIERTKGNLNVNYNFNNLNKKNQYYHVHHSSKKFINLLIKKKLDYLINLGTPRILKKEVLYNVKRGVINIHPGLIQFLRGCTNIEWAILLDKPVGITAHLMSKKIDYGPIIIQKKIQILKNEKYHNIRIKVYIETLKMIRKILRKINQNKIIKSKKINFKKNYYKPINSFQMKMVFKKIKLNQYKYQI